MLLIERKDYFSDQEFNFISYTLACPIALSTWFKGNKLSSRELEYIMTRYYRCMHQFFDVDNDGKLGVDIEAETREYIKSYINSPNIKRIIFEHIIETGEDITNITTDSMVDIAISSIQEVNLEYIKYSLSTLFKHEYIKLNFSENQKKLALYLFSMAVLLSEIDLDTAKELTLYIANEYSLETEYVLEIYDIASNQANLFIQIDKQSENLLDIIS